MLPPLFPLLRAEFGVCYATLGALLSVIYVASGLCQFGADFAVDRLGARPVLLAGLALLAGGTLAAGLVPGVGWLFPLVALMGIGNGVFHPADFAVLNANVNPRRLGHAYSSHGIGGNLGYALAPVVSFGLGSAFGWRTSLLACGAFGLVAVAVLATQRGALDSRKHGVTVPKHTLAGSLQLFRQRPILLCFAYFCVLTIATIGITTFLGTSLNAAYGLPLAIAATAITAYLLGSTAGILAGGFLAARTSRHDRVAATGLAVGAVLILLLALFAPLAAWAIPLLALTGLGARRDRTVARHDRARRNAEGRIGPRLRIRLFGSRSRVLAGAGRDGRNARSRLGTPGRRGDRGIYVRGDRHRRAGASARGCLLPLPRPATERRLSVDLGTRRQKSAGLRREQGLGTRLRGSAGARGCRGDDRRAHRGRSRSEPQKISARWPAAPCAWVACDITTAEGRGKALAACPQPDILVNNAGGPPPGDFRDWDRDAWIRALDANMLTPIELIKATVDGMIERQFGRIVNITSSAVKAPIDILGLSNGARSGLTGFVAGLARKVARHNVTINNLLPGPFDTDRLRTNIELRAKAAGRPMAELRQAQMDANPAGRFGTPAEFGVACAFLCSAHAGYIVGQNILLDGGGYPGTF